jgi:hypothetical protein
MEDDGLTRLNGEIHERLDEALLEIMERLTELDIAAAHTRWGAVRESLLAHRACEDGGVHQRYAELGERPRGAAPELFLTDHVTLERLAGVCEEVIVALGSPSSPLRRQVVLALPHFYRLRNLLEHHTLREQRFFYPALDEHLSDEERAGFIEELAATAL